MKKQNVPIGSSASKLSLRDVLNHEIDKKPPPSDMREKLRSLKNEKELKVPINTITFEKVEGKENIYLAKITREGKVHQISVYAIPEDEFNKAQEKYRRL